MEVSFSLAQEEICLLERARFFLHEPSNDRAGDCFAIRPFSRLRISQQVFLDRIRQLERIRNVDADTSSQFQTDL